MAERRPPRVLVVDDDPVVRLLASQALAQLGFTVEEAVDGETAVGSVDREHPDLILLDLEMPGIGGLETCQLVRQRHPTSEIPILVATGLTEDHTIDAAFEAGATDFVKKPIDWQLLQHRVRFIMRASRAMARLQEARRAAEAANRAKLDFLANMSHEIRTPMTAIVGFLDALHGADADPLSEAERETAVATIQRNAGHLLNLIDDMLDVCRIDSGKLRLQIADCDPCVAASEVVDALRPGADAKHLNLALVCTEAVRLRTDPTRLRQVLSNLVANAIKFTDSGHVEIRVGLAEGGGAAFEVKDSGIGMTEEQIERAFLPFTQIDESSSRRRGGAGLGLSIVQRLVHALEGEIRVTSRPGQGSVFTVRLPSLERGEQRRALRAAPPAPSAPVAAGVALDQCRVLVVEDGPDNRRLLGFLLRKLGADVTFAENGRVGVDVAQAAEPGEPFDLVLMDMQMPVLDGYGATAELRAAGFPRPIVAVTAHAMEGDRERCLEAGCDDYITKPVNRATLARLLRLWQAKAASR